MCKSFNLLVLVLLAVKLFNTANAFNMGVPINRIVLSTSRSMALKMSTVIETKRPNVLKMAEKPPKKEEKFGKSII